MSNDAMREEICKDYQSSLEELTFNSKPYINMLTILAEENQRFAKDIVAIIEAQIAKAPPAQKLPLLYLVDSIVKNLRGEYLAKFAKNIITLLISVFEKADRHTRKRLCRLRSTWNGIFPSETLLLLDFQVNSIDHSWPVKRQPPNSNVNVHLNPKFLNPAAALAGSTQVKEGDLRLQTQQHNQAPVKKDKRAEFKEKFRYAAEKDRDKASASKHRPTSMIVKSANAAVPQHVREGTWKRESKSQTDNERKRTRSRSPLAVLPPTKREDSRSPERRPKALYPSANSQFEDFLQCTNARDRVTTLTRNTSNAQRATSSLHGTTESAMKRFSRWEEFNSLNQSEKNLYPVKSNIQSTTSESRLSTINMKQRSRSRSPLSSATQTVPPVPLWDGTNEYAIKRFSRWEEFKILKQSGKNIYPVKSSIQCTAPSESKLSAVNVRQRSRSPLSVASKRDVNPLPVRRPNDFSLHTHVREKITTTGITSYTQGGKGSAEDVIKDSATKRCTGQAEFNYFRHSQEKTCHMKLNPQSMTRFELPLSQQYPAGLSAPSNHQDCQRPGPSTFDLAQNQGHPANLHSHHLSHSNMLEHRLAAPINTCHNAPQSFQKQHSVTQGECFNRLPAGGASTIPSSFQGPVVPFYNTTVLAPSFQRMATTSFPSSNIPHSMSTLPGFGKTQPAVPSFPRQPFNPPLQNAGPFTQPGLKLPSAGSSCDQVNVNNLVTRLISVGLIKPAETDAAASARTKSSKTQPVTEKQEKEDFKNLPDLTGFVKEDLQQRYVSAVTKLYSGKQCSSCGLRFNDTQNEEYRDHLDWHYRQNQTKKDISKRAAFRGWYCSVKDWIEHDDLADLEERAKKSQFFERAREEVRQQTQKGLEKKLQTVRAALDVVDESCEVCREKFDMDWEDEKEEWHLKNAIRIDGQPYHPSCYEDYKKTY